MSMRMRRLERGKRRKNGLDEPESQTQKGEADSFAAVAAYCEDCIT